MDLVHKLLVLLISLMFYLTWSMFNKLDAVHEKVDVITLGFGITDTKIDYIQDEVKEVTSELKVHMKNSNDIMKDLKDRK